jgi:hypothetical protein
MVNNFVSPFIAATRRSDQDAIEGIKASTASGRYPE